MTLEINMVISEMVKGTFITEYKNRFKVIVNIGGNDTLCYMPSSSRIGRLINLPGKTTFLVPIKKKNSKFPYLVYAIRYKNSYALLDLQEANKIVVKALKRKQFNFLGTRTIVAREKFINGYKSDLYVQDTKTLVEIKSILSFSKMAIFPSVHSDRAIEQLKKLRQLLEQGYNVYYFLISMYTSVEEVYLNKTEEEFCKNFKACLAAGMKVRAFGLGVKKGEFYIKKRVHICCC